jgi:AcrR family transcriptional regulator
MGSSSRGSSGSGTRAGPARAVRHERFNRDQNVIDAAIAVMSERGYAGTSVQEIADRVGVLKGSLYHYFSSKEELLYRVLTESHAQADRIAEEVQARGLEPVDELLEFLRQLCLWFLTHVERANIYFTESRQLTGDRLVETQQLGKKFVTHLHDLITAARKDGQIGSPLETVLLTDFVLGALNSVRDWPVRSGKKFSTERMADAFVELIRDGLQARESEVRGGSALAPLPAGRRNSPLQLGTEAHDRAGSALS